MIAQSLKVVVMLVATVRHPGGKFGELDVIVIPPQGGHLDLGLSNTTEPHEAGGTIDEIDMPNAGHETSRGSMKSTTVPVSVS